VIDEQVRPATHHDADDLRQLELEARRTLLDQRGGPQLLAEQPAIGDWVAVVQRDDRAVFVGTIDDVVVGYLELGIHGPAAVVHQAYVHPEARELGLGDDMLAAATAVARARGCSVIEGTALPGDRNTKNLYERAGIVARKITVSKSLLLG
jgi:ribosomal protein S18 acetylase RimI-like enzyme